MNQGLQEKNTSNNCEWRTSFDDRRAPGCGSNADDQNVSIVGSTSLKTLPEICFLDIPSVLEGDVAISNVLGGEHRMPVRVIPGLNMLTIGDLGASGVC
ncbi:MAG TPA: hypothetical protein VFV34_11410 [Blastocatellia bacterium]|nr:hypothetical protein [Blastocatellia bacterium]